MQFIDQNFHNYMSYMEFLKKKQYDADNYDLRRRWNVIDFLDRELNVDNINEYIHKHEQQTAKIGQNKIELKYNKKIYKDWGKIQKKVDYYDHMLFRKTYWFDKKKFMKQVGWELNGASNNNIIRYTKFYKNKLVKNDIHSFMTMGAEDADDWLDEFSLLGRFFIPIYFFIASSCIVYMFFFIINFEFMTFFYLLLTLSYLFLF